MSGNTGSREDARPSVARMLALVERHFGVRPERISAPGGKGRDSLRVHLPGRTVIMTFRPDRRRRAREIVVLQRLAAAGAPVPRFLGEEGPVFFQEDLGSLRLSSRLEHARASGREELVRKLARLALASLVRLSDLAMRAGLDEIVPKMGLRAEWRRARVGRIATLSERLGVRPPQTDMDAFAAALRPRRLVFVKWDARAGNAAIHDRRVKWYDWEYCGLRDGLEDPAFLAADEFWPLAPQETLALLATVRPLSEADRVWLADYAVLHAVERLGYIVEQVEKNGWIDEDRARRQDRIGYAPRLLARLARHGAQWAALSRHGQALSPWFGEMEAALRERHPPPSPAATGPV